MMADAGEPVRDERLRLVMLCAYLRLPAPERRGAHAADGDWCSTADIARLFLVPTATMAARLTRSRKSLSCEYVRGCRSGPSWRDRVGVPRTSRIWRSPPGTPRPPARSSCGPTWPPRRSG